MPKKPKPKLKHRPKPASKRTTVRVKQPKKAAPKREKPLALTVPITGSQLFDLATKAAFDADSRGQSALHSAVTTVLDKVADTIDGLSDHLTNLSTKRAMHFCAETVRTLKPPAAEHETPGLHATGAPHPKIHDGKVVEDDVDEVDTEPLDDEGEGFQDEDEEEPDDDDDSAATDQ